jgi:hypothetical protein
MDELKNVFCGECREPLTKDGPCSACGSQVRCFYVTLAIECKSKTHIRVHHKRPGNKRPLVEMIVGKVLRKSVGDFVEKYWRLDRAADRYIEQIKTEDGETLKDVDEPLSSHVGHGSDKPELKAARVPEGLKGTAVR